METVIRNVGELSEAGRTAAEALIGHTLAGNQQLVIQIVPLEEKEAGQEPEIEQDRLPAWCDVYAGLSDERIGELERAISRRLDLTRCKT